MQIINSTNTPKGDVQRINGARYRFKDGQTGTVRWEPRSIFGYFRSDNGSQFTVADSEVTLIKGK